MGLVRIFTQKLRSALHNARIERVYVLDSAPTQVQTKIPVSFECATQLSGELAAKLNRIKGFEVEWSRRFDRHHRCYLGIHRGELVAVGWACPAAWLIGNETPQGKLAPDVMFIYDGFTLERFRGNSIGPARLVFAYQDMLHRGFNRNCLTIADDNFASQRCAVKAGYRPTESVVELHRWLYWIRYRKGGVSAELLAPEHARLAWKTCPE